MAKSVKAKGRIKALSLGWVRKRCSYIVLAIALISLTGVIGHNLYNQPQLKVGTPAPEIIKAPYTDSIENKEDTEIQRQAISKKSTPVLMVDAEINEQIDRNLEQLLDEANEIRAVAQAFPFFDTSVLSLSSQHYLRSCSDLEWQALLVAVENTSKLKSKLFFGKHSETKQELSISKYSRLFASSIYKSQSLNTPPPQQSSKKDKSIDFSQKGDFTQAVVELVAYRLATAEQKLLSLLTQISQARQGYIQAQDKLLKSKTFRLGKVQSETSLLELSDDEWVQTQMEIRQSTERILAQGIPQGLPQSMLENAVNLHVQTVVPKNAELLANKLLLTVLQPNLKQDEEKTKQQIQQIAAGVPPVMVKIEQNDVIVRKGQNITAWHFEVLDHYQLIRRQNNWLGLLSLAGIISGAIGIFVLVEKQIKCKLRQRDRLLILLLTLSIPGVLALGIPYTSWGAVGLLLGSFYRPALGVTVIILLLFVMPIGLEVSIVGLLAGAAGGILGSYIAQRLRSREELALLGVAIALTQGSIYLIIKLLIGVAYGAVWYLVFQQAALFALSGLVWSIVALGLSPYLEKVFDLVTPIRLAELANPNRPLLKRLATETPGTFQHTLFVSTLAEAAAKKLGCNVELVRAGTLYHDIGKMHDPLGFIENQMGEPNKHETEIKDPWKSAEIIKKHVTEGLVMARKHLLPTAIQAFIPEHQGTIVIAYFYHQAEQIAQADPRITVHEADFRYDGPIPQSRETGIVMLADACEAALRSLGGGKSSTEQSLAKEVSTEQALTMLNNILRARWQDNQLIDSGLTRDEMSQIAQIFVEVWEQFHHKRIAYPKLKTSNAVRN